jgi:hypothetical protein
MLRTHHTFSCSATCVGWNGVRRSTCLLLLLLLLLLLWCAVQWPAAWTTCARCHLNLGQLQDAQKAFSKSLVSHIALATATMTAMPPVVAVAASHSSGYCRARASTTMHLHNA